MRSRPTFPIIRWLAIGLALPTMFVAACGGSEAAGPGAVTNPSTSTSTSVPEPLPTSESTPGPGPRQVSLTAGMTWQWQLQGEIDTSHDVDVYDIDLFDAPTEVIDELRDDGRIVICYFSTAFEDWRPDAGDWPSAGLGEPLDDWDGERWVDIRDDDVRSVLTSRLDLAADRGCDGVEPDNVTAHRNDSGFDLIADDQLDFNRFLADEAHDRGLLIGLKNDLEQIPDLVDAFDFAVNEQCVEYDECDVYEPFAAAGKAVFGAEYSDEAVDDPEAVCAAAAASGVISVVLPIDLDGSFRIACR